MKQSSRLIAAISSLLLLPSGVSPSQTPMSGWRAFVSRGGCRIQYPAAWTTASCHLCRDTRAPKVFVDFFPPKALENGGWVMVFPLADKPSTIPLDAWFANVESLANQNPETARLSFVLNGLPARKVRYINKNDRGGVEMEAVYVVSGSRTLSIDFSGDNPGRLETLSNFPAYMKMLESFKVEGSAGKPDSSQ